MKFYPNLKIFYTVSSRPARGARIEISTAWPGGARGRSRPARGARIEIPDCVISAAPIASRPARGARIEIVEKEDSL